MLADALQEYSDTAAVVLGIPRGGVVIADEIARLLNCDLDVVLTHKLAAPGNPELAIGAICEDGTAFVDKKLARYVGAGNNYIQRQKQEQLRLIGRKAQLCREILTKAALTDKVVIVTDDGIATGATMQAALWAICREDPEKIVLALPVGPEDTVRKLSQDADVTICLETPTYFGALGQFFIDFDQVEDDEFLEILKKTKDRRHNL